MSLLVFSRLFLKYHVLFLGNLHVSNCVKQVNTPFHLRPHAYIDMYTYINLRDWYFEYMLPTEDLCPVVCSAAFDRHCFILFACLRHTVQSKKKKKSPFIILGAIRIFSAFLYYSSMEEATDLIFSQMYTGQRTEIEYLNTNSNS